MCKMTLCIGWLVTEAYLFFERANCVHLNARLCRAARIQPVLLIQVSDRKQAQVNLAIRPGNFDSLNFKLKVNVSMEIYGFLEV